MRTRKSPSSRILPADRIWQGCPGASEEALRALREFAGAELPDEYYDFLSFSNGGEGPLSVQPYHFCADSAEDAKENKRAQIYEEFFPGLFVFGSNGGGEYIAFDLRSSKPWPVVAIDMTNINLDESVLFIADSFHSFLAMVGLESQDA